MKAATLPCIMLVGIILSAAQAKDGEESQILGTWDWHHIRHEEVVTFKSDGTYERKYSTAADGGRIHSDKGTWSMNGTTLTMISSKKGSSPITSSIQFVGKDRFELDGFQTYERLP